MELLGTDGTGVFMLNNVVDKLLISLFCAVPTADCVTAVLGLILDGMDAESLIN